MRLPIRSESDAFRAVFVVAAVVAICLALGYWASEWLGVSLASLSVIALLAWMVIDHSRQADVRSAAAAGRQATSEHRTLLIANEAPTREQFRREILPRLGARAVLEIHAPVVQSRTHFVTTDIDSERDRARRRLEEIMSLARSEGIAASGAVGDPIDPLAGVEDELRRYAADQVIITTGTHPDASWVESELLEELSAALDVAVTHVVVDRDSNRYARA
ncbi:MAG TPA: hypothetical protein VKB70_00395 [Gaiellaceae bacterium]|nr:hypothetical protein [Gaiellaceae bacterium]